MKKLLSLVAFILFAGSVAATAGEIKYVNMETLFGKFHKTIEKDNAFKEKKKRVDEIIKMKVDMMQRLRDEGKQYLEQSTNLGITKEKSSELVGKARSCDDSIRKIEAETQEIARNEGEKLKREYLGMRNEIVKELTDYIKEFRRKNNLDMVVDVSGMTTNGIPVIIAYDESKEITEGVLAELNKGFEKDVEKALMQRQKDVEAAETAAKTAPSKN